MSKGPHSIGSNNSNNIGIRMRSLHPSYVSKIDCLVCGNSDPGTSGLLSPFSDINGLYFNPDDEVDDFEYRLSKDLERIYKEKGITYIKLDFDNKDDYYKTLLEMEKMTNDSITMYGTSRENHYEIIFDKEDDVDNEESEEEKE